MKLIFFVSLILLAACANQVCKIEDREDLVVTGNEKVSSADKDLTKRVFIYKADGSLQCGTGEKIDLNTMRKNLGKIEVFSSANKHDGLMRTQVCGAPTGYNNVYEINAQDLETAIKLGFKKWIKN